MSEALNPVITEQGLQAIFNASNNGVEAVITHVALGDRGYSVPLDSNGRATQTALRNEKQRVDIADGRRAAPDQIDLSFVAEGPSTYWVRELGFYLGDNTLFAVWSDANRALAWKSDTVPLVVGLELVLATLPAESVTVQPGAVPLQLIMTRELAAVGTAIANLQLEQLRQGEQIRSTVAQLEAQNASLTSRVTDLQSAIARIKPGSDFEVFNKRITVGDLSSGQAPDIALEAHGVQPGDKVLLEFTARLRRKAVNTTTSSLSTVTVTGVDEQGNPVSGNVVREDAIHKNFGTSADETHIPIDAMLVTQAPSVRVTMTRAGDYTVYSPAIHILGVFRTMK